ncbi:Efflux pump [Penicillium capsulatum]|uniref:Efflux pump n=1 Tax=Penicillium capsulatum TaxID=69766 RepID=A0A9W9HV24_9EURO|nr:Efflux pump [Penicillium capsulatum]
MSRSFLVNSTALRTKRSGPEYIFYRPAVLQLTFSSLSQTFARKQLILLPLSLFPVGSIIAAVAKNFIMPLVGRSIQGAERGRNY